MYTHYNIICNNVPPGQRRCFNDNQNTSAVYYTYIRNDINILCCTKLVHLLNVANAARCSCRPARRNYSSTACGAPGGGGRGDGAQAHSPAAEKRNDILCCIVRAQGERDPLSAATFSPPAATATRNHRRPSAGSFFSAGTFDATTCHQRRRRRCRSTAVGSLVRCVARARHVVRLHAKLSGRRPRDIIILRHYRVSLSRVPAAHCTHTTGATGNPSPARRPGGQRHCSAR